jgi:hypothetical protein
MSKKEKDNELIAIPNNMIRNHNITCKTFVLLLTIKRKCVYSNQKIFYAQELMDELHINDTRTLKKHINILFDNNIINTKYKEIRRNELLNFELEEDINEEGFTMVSTDIIDKIKSCTEKIVFITKSHKTKQKDSRYEYKDLYDAGIRFYYYIKFKFYVDKGYARMNYEEIEKDIRISAKTIRALNIEFNRNGIVEVIEGEWRMRDVNNSGVEIKCKDRNTYIPICEKIGDNKKKGKKKNNDNETENL